MKCEVGILKIFYLRIYLFVFYNVNSVLGAAPGVTVDLPEQLCLVQRRRRDVEDIILQPTMALIFSTVVVVIASTYFFLCAVFVFLLPCCHVMLFTSNRIRRAIKHLIDSESFNDHSEWELVVYKRKRVSKAQGRCRQVCAGAQCEVMFIVVIVVALVSWLLIIIIAAA